MRVAAVIVTAFSASCAALADTGTNEQSTNEDFQLNASVENGCQLGGGAGDVNSFGTLSFGQQTTLDEPVDVSSAGEQGSIILRCTPGASVTIAIDAGQHAANVAAGRYLAKGSDRLRYQLYQDAARSIIWGDGSNGGTALSTTFSGDDSVSYPIHARLFSAATLPSAGLYSDVVTVTVTY